MDGLPKNKKPWGKAEAPKQIGLDDYLFGRKLQEVYDKKQESNDFPKLFKKAKNSLKKLNLKSVKFAKRKKQLVVHKAKKPVIKLIDAPYIAPKKFKIMPNKPQPKAKKLQKTKVNKLKIIPKNSLLVPVIAVLFVGSVFAIINKFNQPKKDIPKVQGVVSPQKPDFQTVTPKNNTQSTKVKFDPTKRVATFEDVIQGSRIVVSQQKLGETELKDTEFLKRTALNFNLKTELTTLKGTAYVGINLDKNVQIAIFIYQDFLIFIQTETTYKNQVIIDYIQSLQ